MSVQDRFDADAKCSQDHKVPSAKRYFGPNLPLPFMLVSINRRTSALVGDKLTMTWPPRAKASEKDPRSRSAARRYLRTAALAMAWAAIVPAPSLSQSLLAQELPEVEFGSRKIFLMLFLMLGPIKILVPFNVLAGNLGPSARRQLATRAILFSAAALAIAGFLGRTMLENLEISLPVLAMTGGIILFIVALRTVLQPAGDLSIRPMEPGKIDLKLALTPLAFPTIVPPYGIAAVIVFATLAGDRQAEELTMGAMVLLILALDWLAMMFAGPILRWIGTSLQVLAVVLGVTQAALGLQIILHSLSMIWR